MSNIIPFDSTGATGATNLPAHLANVFGEEGNIAPRVSIDQLSYRGKVWRRIVAGEETQLTRVNNESGEVEPIPIVQVIILDHNKQRSRSYFEGNYEEGKNAAPRCYSSDGVKPDGSVKEPIAATCATCPNAVKGSKITENGKQTTLCSPFKRVAVVPAQNIGQHPALLLKLAQTSIWDKDNPEEAKGWYSWDQYLDMLRARGAKHTAMVETRVKFDLKVAYPKLLFSASRWLAPEEALAAKKVMDEKADVIDSIVNGAGNSDGVMGQPTTNGAAPAPAPTQAPAPAPTLAPMQAPAPATAAQAAAQAAPAAPKKPPAAPKPPAAKKITKKIDLEKTDGFTLEQMLESGWSEEQLVAEGMLTIVEEVDTAAAAPKPRGPRKPPAAPAPAPATNDDSGGFPPAQAPAQSAPAPVQQAAAPAVVGDTPAGLADLLNGWDDGADS
jgi:hypothetical protein